MSALPHDVAVAGVGLTPFGRHAEESVGSLARQALATALQDGGVDSSNVDLVVFANAAAGLLTGQEMIRGQVAMKGSGLEGAPILNTENACASGSSAAHMAWLAVASGQSRVAVALGAERLTHPDKRRSFAAIASGIDQSLALDEVGGSGSAMMAAYARAARAYARRHGDVEQALAALAVKNRRHAADNPMAQFRTPISADDVAASREVAAPLRLLMCSPITDGGAAIVFQRSADVELTMDRRPVTVTASVVGSHRHGDPVVARAANEAYRRTSMSPDDIDVFQLHDACAFAELIQYEQVGLVPEGDAAEAVLTGLTARFGKHPTNTDGGLMSRGHPLGATGIAQLAELTLQLQGRAGGRQVEAARAAMAVNSGGWMGDDYATATATILTQA